MGADVDGAVVGEEAVFGDEHVLANVDVVTVVAVERGLEHGARAEGAGGSTG